MSDRLEEIRARADAAAAGPWFWRGNVDTYQLRLSRTRPGFGECTVMDFVRWGMQFARPRFTMPGDSFFMDNADRMPVFEVCPDATERTDPRLYRGDVVGIRHPDAEFIAHSRADVDWLVAEVDRLRAALTDGATSPPACTVRLGSCEYVAVPAAGGRRACRHCFTWEPDA